MGICGDVWRIVSIDRVQEVYSQDSDSLFSR